MEDKKTSTIPSDAELAILRVLWKQGPATAKEIHGQLNAGRKAPRVVTTTAKLLQIMMTKEQVTRDDSTWPHIYRAAVSRSEIQRSIVSKTVNEVFDKSASQFFLAALESGAPSKAELAEIKAMLEAYEERRHE